jgi:hypothetical protein
MDCIEIFPTLTCCIETRAREEFQNAVGRYMKGGREDQELERKIELVRAFLESADFKELRARSEKHLVQGENVKFVICPNEGKSSYKMVVT